MARESRFSFIKGNDDILKPKEGADFDWEKSASVVREHLSDAMNARNVAFLFGSGCSSQITKKLEVGIPTMKSLAQEFIGAAADLDQDEDGGEEEDFGDDDDDDSEFISREERTVLLNSLGLDIGEEEYSRNLERLMEVLYSAQVVLRRSKSEDLAAATSVVESVIGKITRYILKKCTEGPFSITDDTVLNTYSSFYRKLVYRDRALPRPWVFTTNYDLFNETAMDKLAIPYCNGFSGLVDRRFNPATFRYSLAEQLDISSRKWTAVDNFVYLCKLHGSVNWVEAGDGLFPIREMQTVPEDTSSPVMIYPTPAKQNSSFGSPYSDLFREFQNRVVRDQSVLFVVGYSFGDEHVNNIIFQSLTIPTFRMIAFLPPDAEGIPRQLKELNDPRVWIIGGEGKSTGKKAHYFDSFVEHFMPEPPGDKVDTAIAKAVENLLSKRKEGETEVENDF